MSKENRKGTVVSDLAGVFIGAGITLTILRLCGVINWAWHLVLMPLWAPVAFSICIALAAAVVAIAVALTPGGRVLNRNQED